MDSNQIKRINKTHKNVRNYVHVYEYKQSNKIKIANVKKSVEGGDVLPKTGNFEFNFNVKILYAPKKWVGDNSFIIHNLIFYIYLRKMFAATCQCACCEHSYKLYNFGVHCA